MGVFSGFLFVIMLSQVCGNIDLYLAESEVMKLMGKLGRTHGDSTPGVAFDPNSFSPSQACPPSCTTLDKDWSMSTRQSMSFPCPTPSDHCHSCGSTASRPGEMLVNRWALYITFSLFNPSIPSLLTDAIHDHHIARRLRCPDDRLEHIQGGNSAHKSYAIPCPVQMLGHEIS